MATGSNHGFLDLLPVIIFTLILTFSSSLATAYKFNVGGKDGWVVKPSEDYSHWAQRNRFQVNDTLYFRYKKGSDSVMLVKKEDYDSCNPKNAMHKMEGGDSTFKFDRSGPFFFISGNVENCQRGQKLIVVVLAVRHKHIQSHPPAASPSEVPSPAESVSPPSEVPSPAESVLPPSEVPSPAESVSPPSELPSPAESVSPPSEVPSPSSGMNSPVPSPAKHSGSTRFSGSVGVALGASVGLVLFFSSFA